MKMPFWHVSGFDRSTFRSPSGKTVGKYIYIKKAYPVTLTYFPQVHCHYSPHYVPIMLLLQGAALTWHMEYGGINKRFFFLFENRTLTECKAVVSSLETWLLVK